MGRWVVRGRHPALPSWTGTTGALELEPCSDQGRAVRPRAEIDALTEQLAAACGLGGRVRTVGDVADRACKAGGAVRQQRPDSNPVMGQKSLARQGRRGLHHAPQRASARSSGECRLGIGLAPGNGEGVRSAIVERCDGCRGVGALHVASRPQRMLGRQPTSSGRVSSARCIMFVMSACHGRRCQVVEHGRRSPARPAPHREQAVGRAFLRPGWISCHRIGPSARAFGRQQTVTGFVSHHEGRES